MADWAAGSQLHCQSCGAGLAAGAKFCESCGATVASSRFCPNCGAELSATAQFCGGCGSRLGAQSAPAISSAPPSTYAPPPPAGLTAPPPPPAVAPAPASSGMKLGTGLLIGLGFWIIVAIAAFIFAPIEAVYGVGLAAAISLGLALLNYNEAWEGTVERIETRRVRVRYGNTNRYHNEDQLHAIVRLTNGKKKDFRCLTDWSVGDRLIKRRGESMIRIPVGQA